MLHHLSTRTTRTCWRSGTSFSSRSVHQMINGRMTRKRTSRVPADVEGLLAVLGDPHYRLEASREGALLRSGPPEFWATCHPCMSDGN